MLTVWGRSTSSNVQPVMWCLAELGLKYERLDIGHVHGGNDTPAYLSMNPNGLVPVVRDGDEEPLWESGAILRYLANRYGAEPFWPSDASARAQVDKWAEWVKVTVVPNFTRPIFWQLVRTRPADRDAKVVAAAVARMAELMAIAERQIGDEGFLVGRHLTLADIQFGTLLYRYFDVDIQRPSLPAVERYYAALTERPAYAEHVMVSYQSLRVT